MHQLTENQLSNIVNMIVDDYGSRLTGGEVSEVIVQTTQRYAHLESRDVSQRARDIMEALNSVPDSDSVDSDAGVVGVGS